MDAWKIFLYNNLQKQKLQNFSRKSFVIYHKQREAIWSHTNKFYASLYHSQYHIWLEDLQNCDVMLNMHVLF